MNTLESNWSPMTSILAETAPQNYTELFDALEAHCEASTNSKLELSSVLGAENPLSKLMAQSGAELLVDELDRRLQVMEMSDFVKLWSALDSVRSTYHAGLVVGEAAKVDEVMTESMLAEMKRLKDMSEGVDFNLLADGMRLMIDELREDAHTLTAAEFGFKFLTSFVYRVMGQIEAPTNFWEIILLKLESRFLPSTLYPEMSPLFTVFRILESNLQNQPALFEFCLFSEEMVGAEKIAANIAGLAFAKAAPLQHRRELFMKLDAEFFYELDIVGEFSDKNAPWRSALHKRLERSFAELFIDAADGAIELRDNLTILINESRQRETVAKAIAADLSQGMTGSNVLNRIADNCTRVMNAAACAQLLSSNFIEAKELFIPVITAELGIGPRAELWRKHSQLFSGLARATSEMGSELNWTEIGKLFTALDRRVTEMQGRPLRWMELPESSQILQAGSAKRGDWLGKLLRLVSIRLVIDERLYGSRWKQTITQWLVDQLLAPTQLLDEKSLEDLLIAAFTDPKIAERDDLTLDSKHLESMSRTFAGVVSRAAAASALFRASETIASGVSDDVLYALPDYAERVGEAGRISCQQDNQITLLKVSELLLASEEDPSEKLSEWWTSLIGSYLANRPDALFEENLKALYRNIGKHLSTVHTDAVFNPIQAMYNDSLSVSCIEALASRPIEPIGKLIKNVPVETPGALAVDKFLEAGSSLRAISVEGLDDQKAEALLNLLVQYHRALWLEGSSDIAAARILPALNALDIDAPLSKLAGEFVVALESDESVERIDLLQQSAHAFADLVYRCRIAALLDTHSADVAQYFSESMIGFAPKHFEHLSHDAAVSKCSRDQTLLLRKLANFTRNSTPILAWFDLTRYFLELQSAFVDYPDRIWMLSFRTITKTLAKHLSPAENILLTRLMEQGESLAKVWSQTHDIAKAFFDPSDYAFSAKADLDKHCRDLLTTVITASSMRGSGDIPRQTFLNRVFLSLDLSILDEAGIDEVITLVETRAGDHLSAQQSTLLKNSKTDIVSLAAAYRSEESALTGLAKVDPRSRQLECLYAPGDETGSEPNPVLAISRRVARLTALENNPSASKRSAFSAELASQLLQYFAAGYPETNASTNHASVVGQLSDTQRAHHGTAQTGILQTLLPQVIDAVKLIGESDDAAEQFLHELRSGEHGPYSLGAEQCKETTKEGFAYSFRTAAVASLLPTVSAPSLFFGRARENHQLIKLSVAANAHAQTALKIRQLLPRQPLAGFAIACDPLMVEGTLWKKVAFESEVVPEKTLLADRSVFTELLDPVASLDSALGELLSSYFDELENSGDWQMAQTRCVASIRIALESHECQVLAHRLQTLTASLDSGLGPARSVFWALHCQIISETVRQVAIGLAISQHADAAARAYVAQKHSDTKTEQALQCYRDQRYTLELVGASLSALGASAAALNPIKFHVDHVVGYLKNSPLELSQAWAFYEEWFAGELPLALKPTLHVWFGRFMNSYGRSVRIADFVREALPSVAHELAETFELKVSQVTDFLSGLCAAALLDVDSETSTVLGHAERIVLGSQLPEFLSEASLADFLKAIEASAEAHAAGKVPNLLKRVFIELPDVLARSLAAASAEGSSLARFYIANANDPIVPALWKASNLARCSLESRTLEADRNDALVARTIGAPLPEDESVIKELIAAKRGWTAIKEAELTPPPKKKSLFGLIGKSSGAEVDWVNDREMRTAAETVCRTIIRSNLLNQAIQPYCLFVDSFLDSTKMEHEKASIELFACLRSHFVNALGEQHELVNSVNEYVDSMPNNYSAHRLIESRKPGGLFFGLVCAKLRTADEGVAYFTTTQPEAALDTINSENPGVIGEGTNDLLKAAVAELKQSIL